MHLLVALAVVVSVVTAVRSTWSPCGVSMLSSITPLSERGRGRHWGVTAAWFVAGAVAGGTTLGVGAAALAVGVDAASVGTTTLLAIAGALAAVSALADSGVLGIPWPRHTRQVDDVWISRYRGWVCGLGFGWQIGVGLATFVVTPAVYLTIALAALTGDAATAFGVCALFGFVRGLAILAGARLTSPAALVAFHRRFEAWRTPGRVATIAVQAAVAVAALGDAASSTAVAAGAAAAVLVAVLVVAAVSGAARRAPELRAAKPASS
jgi:hypothetical protein